MKRTSIKSETVVTVTEVTVTLTLREVERISECLRVYGHYDLVGEFDRMIDPTPYTAEEWYASGAGDDLLREGKPILSIKECRTATQAGLKEAKDAMDARKRWLGLW